ncbi:MAG: energy-coupling factor transporter transmembrane component T family protein [Promethearchaeota archaeon]
MSLAALTFHPKQNTIYKANPIIKLIFLIVLMVMSFIFDNPAYMLFLLIYISIFVYFSACIKETLAFAKFAGYIAIFLVIINIIFIRNGDTILYSYSGSWKILQGFRITLESIISSIQSVIRLLIMLVLFGILNVIINPDDLMKSLLKLRMPYPIALIITMSLQFFPILTKDLNQLKEIQKCQGIEFEKGKLLTKLKNNINLLLPLLTNSLERSIQISEALEARGFHISKNRSTFHPIYFSIWDICAIFFTFVLLGLGILANILGYTQFTLYPKVSMPSFSVYSGVLIILNSILGSFIIFSLYQSGNDQRRDFND